MNMQTLEEKQKEFQKEAHKILDDLQLSKLSQYGEYEIVGSMLLGTMLYPDIDITVRSTPVNETGYWETVQLLLKNPRIEKVTLMDTRNHDRQSIYPSGLYINCSYLGEPCTWNLDIWFFRVLHPDEPNNNAWLKKNMTEEQRKIILLLKDAAIKSGKYKSHIFSMDIYDAVMKHRVKDIREFKTYLATIGKNL